MISGLLMVIADTIQARSVTCHSIWSQTNALARAQSLLPAGAVVSSSQCQTVEVGLDNERYLCSITYELPPAPPAGLIPSGGTTP